MYIYIYIYIQREVQDVGDHVLHPPAVQGEVPGEVLSVPQRKEIVLLKEKRTEYEEITKETKIK